MRLRVSCGWPPPSACDSLHAAAIPATACRECPYCCAAVLRVTILDELKETEHPIPRRERMNGGHAVLQVTSVQSCGFGTSLSFIRACASKCTRGRLQTPLELCPQFPDYPARLIRSRADGRRPSCDNENADGCLDASPEAMGMSNGLRLLTARFNPAQGNKRSRHAGRLWIVILGAAHRCAVGNRQYCSERCRAIGIEIFAVWGELRLSRVCALRRPCMRVQFWAPSRSE